MLEKTPDYVNDVPEWYGLDWPEERRCGYVFARFGEYRDRYVKDRVCGYPALANDDMCAVHSESARTSELIREELEGAVAIGAYLGEAKLDLVRLSGVDPDWTGPGPKPLQIPAANLNWGHLKRAMLVRGNMEGASLPYAQLQLADLTKATLRGANFTGAHLEKAMLSLADMQDAQMGHANLQDAYLHRADLSRTMLRNSKLEGAHLDDAILRRADLSGANLHDACLTRADLTWAIARGAIFTGSASLRGALLIDAYVAGAEFSPEADLDGVRWWRTPVPVRKMVSSLLNAACRGRFFRLSRRLLTYRQRHHPALKFRDERELPTRPPSTEKLREAWFDRMAACERTARQIKRAYQESGQYDKAGEFFIREMECKRKQASGMRRAGLWLMHVLSDYFESPGRVAGIAVSMIIVFAYINGCLGLCDCSGSHQSASPQWPTVPTWEGVKYFITTCLYFSMVTFTTLGYGDIHSANGWGRIACSIEAATGAVMLALFLVCLARKYGRA
ncbi:MAG: pentapeptide repeat-containing protein [Armatimonadia bacterium]